jgi:adenosylhomocysteine nucleosidase
MESIGILAAMPQESAAMLHLLHDSERTSLGSFRCDRFRLLDRDCWLLTSGMGIERAARAARMLIETIHPQLLVSVGVAGAVNADLEIGDVVAARTTCLLEQGRLGQSQPLAYLSDAAWQAAVQALQPRQARLLPGTAVTTRGTQSIQAQPVENPILEMETAGIAGVAAENGIPLLSLRAISDGPRAPIPFDLEAMLDADSNLRMGAIMKSLLAHPKMIPALLRMSRNTTKAAQNAAIALVAALRQPGPVVAP